MYAFIPREISLKPGIKFTLKAWEPKKQETKFEPDILRLH
jgi:hypothetical protein